MRHRASPNAARTWAAAEKATMTYDPQAQPGPLGEPLLTCREAAGLLAIKPAWIYDAALGPSPLRRRRTPLRLLRSDLEAFLAQQRTAPPPQVRR
jgi:hypothetical protein